MPILIPGPLRYMRLMVKAVLFFLICVPQLVVAQEFSALARVQGETGSLRDTWRETTLRLPLTQAVPVRVYRLSQPNRIVVDFAEVDFAGFDPFTFDQSDRVTAVIAGPGPSGWSRMVLTLDAPLLPKVIEMTAAQNGLGAAFTLVMEPVKQAKFDDGAGPPVALVEAPSPPLVSPKPRQTGQTPLIVVLDPGHGGLDPGATYEDLSEAPLVLTFAKELADLLERYGIQAVLTRTEDSFVPLSERMTRARAARGDILISLHVDIVPQGYAEGLTIYTLSPDASAEASSRLTLRHERSDLLAGVDLQSQGDEVAQVLMEMVRLETVPRAAALASRLFQTLTRQDIRLNKTPIRQSDFVVLRAADIPSILVELGFLSAKVDRQMLTTAKSRKAMQQAMVDAIRDWADQDAAEARLRQH